MAAVEASRADSVRTLVILGTGTGVGKTWVAAGIARALRELGAFVWALKPIESGVAPGAWGAEDGSDATLLASVSSEMPGEPPYRLVDAVSPHLAAWRAGRRIDVPVALRYVQSYGPGGAPQTWVLVETAGALLSPLAPGNTNWELARALEPALWVLVAPDSLGVLHDLSASLEVMRTRGRKPDFVVLSAAREPDASTGTNADELDRLDITESPVAFGRGDSGEFQAFAQSLLEFPWPPATGVGSSRPRSA